jgi:hypothetical protein
MYLYWLTQPLPFWWGVGAVYIAALALDWGAVLTIAAWEMGFSWSEYPCTKWGVPVFLPLIPASETACLYHVRQVPDLFDNPLWSVGILAFSLAASYEMERRTINRNGVWFWYQKWHGFIVVVIIVGIVAGHYLALFAPGAAWWKALGLSSAAAYGISLAIERRKIKNDELPPYEYMGSHALDKSPASPA